MELRRWTGALLLLAVLLAGSWWMRPAGPLTKALAAPGLIQATAEPVESPTPLPTLADINSSASPGSLVAVGLMLVCVMGLMLVGGVGIAILIVRIRNRVR